MTQRVFLGLGSNIGDKVTFLAMAIRRIGELENTSVEEVSHVYKTEPVGDIRQDYFLNVCISVKTEMDPEQFHRNIKFLEKSIGRMESQRWGPREIDIDILLFGSLVISNNAVTIPHREIVNRKFVLQPLSDIAPLLEHPVEKKSILQLNRECSDPHAVEYSEIFSSQLTLLIHDPTSNQAV